LVSRSEIQLDRQPKEGLTGSSPITEAMGSSEPAEAPIPAVTPPTGDDSPAFDHAAVAIGCPVDARRRPDISSVFGEEQNELMLAHELK
jgi:hypothetical protein